MKFSVVLADFAKVLNKVLPAVPRKSTLPVLEHLHFNLIGNDLQIVATDQDIIIKAGVIVDGISDGSVLVPARRLNEIVKALDNIGKIEFNASLDNFDITLKTDVGNYDMKGLDPDEYLHLPELFESAKPDLDNMTADPEANIAFFKREDIQRLTNQTSFAVSQDEFRPAMTGVLFQFRKEYVHAVATDSFRLVRITAFSDQYEFPDEFDVIIPARAVELLRKVEADVLMSSLQNYGKITHLRFDIDDTVFITRIIDERFPPYETVIPLNNDLTMIASRKEFLAAIKRVSIFTSNISHQVRVTINNDHFVIGGEDEESGSKGIETLSCDFNGEMMTLCFNVKYLDEAIQHLEQATEGPDNIYMFISEPTKPVLVNTEMDSRKTLMLLMPVRLPVAPIQTPAE